VAASRDERGQAGHDEGTTLAPVLGANPGWDSRVGATRPLPNADFSGPVHMPNWCKGEPAAALGGIRLTPRAPWLTGQRAAKARHNGQRPNASPGSPRRPADPRRQARRRALSLSLTSVLVRPFTLHRIMMHGGETCNPLLGGGPGSGRGQRK